MTTFNSTMGQANRGFRVIVGGAALALAALTGVAGYQVGLHSHDGARQVVTQPVTAPGGLAVAPVAGPAVDSIAVVTSAGGAVRAGEHPMLVLVGSTEQAQSVEAGIEAANVIRATMGLGPLSQTVQQVASAADAATLARSIVDANQLGGALGLPDIEVVDLRN